MTKRRSMHMARKRRIHEAHSGLCEICKQPVPLFGPDVRYDHRLPLWMSHSDDDANIRPIHKICDAPKTAQDATDRAKVKRIGMKHRGEKPPTKRPIRARSFDKHFTRGFDGRVKERKARRDEAREASHLTMENGNG